MNNYSLILLIALISGLLSCGSSEGEIQQEATNGIGYETFTLSMSGLQGTFRLPGELKPFEAVNIYPKSTGFIQSVKVDRGSRVKKNEILAEIEAPEVLAEMAAAKAKVQSAEGNLQQSAALLETSRDRYNRISQTAKTPGAISAGDLFQLENKLKEDSASYAAAVSNLEAAKFNLEASRQLSAYLTLKAPFDGVITERNVHTGTFISSQGGENRTPLFRLEMNQKLRLEIPIPENYAGLDFEGDSISFSVNSNPGKSFFSTISRIAGSLSPQTRTEMIEADVDNTALELIGGSFAQVNLSYRKEDTFVIPASALITNMEDRFVVKVVGNTAYRIPVKKGMAVKENIEIFGDLQVGDLLIKNPSETIRTGDIIKMQ